MADELGVRSIAFPLISSGVYGWPVDDAIAAAIDTIANADTRVENAMLVAFGADMYDEICRQLETRR